MSNTCTVKRLKRHTPKVSHTYWYCSMPANESAVMTASHAGESLDYLNQPVQPILCQDSFPVHSNTPPIVWTKEEAQ